MLIAGRASSLKIMLPRRNILIIILFNFFIFSSLSIATLFAEDITISTNTTWNSGNYIYGNVLITNNATLTFNGRISLTAQNLFIDSGSSISADVKGYPNTQGPGAGKWGSTSSSGAGYGGKGGNSVNGLTGGAIYGSALVPVDLGSGGGGGAIGGAGGGAIILNISKALTVNGSITSRGGSGYGGGGSGSGGSIYVTTNTLAGSGSFIANGGDLLYGGGGGGGGGRIALYYNSSLFTGIAEAKGGIGWQRGEDGTVVSQAFSNDSSFSLFNLAEKSSTNNTSIEAISSQGVILNNINVSGDLRGSFNFASFEIITITTGPFAQKGFFKAEWVANLEGLNYSGTYKGMIYPDPKENKIYLKGLVEGGLKGIAETEFIETIPESNTYDRYLGTWKLNSIGVETVASTIKLEGTLSYQPPHYFNSGLYFYQADMEGFSFGHYSGPLSAVVTHIRLTGENEYQGQGFSLLSYTSRLGQGEGFSFSQLNLPAQIELQGLFTGPLLGILNATLNEAASPKTLSGRVERLDLGLPPAPDLKVKVWGPQRISPGQTIAYIIEYRNDGVKSATEAIVYFYPNALVTYNSASQGAYYNNYAHRVTWNLSALPAKAVGYLSIQVKLPAGLPQGLTLENRAYILDIILHSTEENGAANGIGFDPSDTNGNKDFEQFAHDNDAKWFKLYANTNFITGPLEAYLASKDITTSRNEVGQESEANGYRPKWMGFSGGGTTFTNQAKQGRISGQDLYLISPQVVTQEDIRAAKKQFNKIVVYQGDDLLPNEGITFKTNSSTITIPWSSLPNTLTKDKIIELVEPSDNTVKDLIKKLEEDQGNKTLDYLEIFPQEEGNGIKITWKEGGTTTSFLTTYILKSEDGIEVMTIPGIKHDEWFPVFNLFREKYGRLPMPDEDNEKLIETLKEFREKTSSQSQQEIATAHDPNEILVSPEGDVRPGDRLNYTINYENEGQGIAYGVYITDTLEEDLDASALSINNGGIYDVQTRTITWFVGELASQQKGSLLFNVNVRPDALDKSEVINFATVYFPSVPEATRTNGTVNRITTYIDNIPPTTAASTSPSSNQAGWNNTDVTITLSATDNEGGLGVAKTEYSLDGTNWFVYTNSFTITNEAITKVYYRSTDNTGNVEVTKSLEIEIDKTPPAIVFQLSPQPNSFGWNNTDVTVSFTATDNLSGVAFVTQPQIITTEGENQRLGGQAVDLAGNQSATSITLNIDKTQPEVLINVPQNLMAYTLNQTIFSDWSAQDNLSGIDSVVSTAPRQQPLNLTSVGPKAFSVSAKDKAGNQKDLAITYKVIYNYSGVLPPIKTDGSGLFKLGSTIPVKFQLRDAQGNFITNAVAKLSIQKYSNNEPMGEPIEVTSTAESTTGSLFRYDTTDNQYIFNLSTKALATGLWQLKIELDDGEKYTVFVGLK